MKQLKPGDPCPCCGRPIKTRDPDVLRLLGFVQEHGRLPTPKEIGEILENDKASGTAESELIRN